MAMLHIFYGCGCVCVEVWGGDIFYVIRLPCNHQIGAKVVDARLRYVSIGETHLVQHIVHPILDATIGFGCVRGQGNKDNNHININPSRQYQ